MSMHEIVLPETKPETEWVRGLALQKVSPSRDHARLQLRLSMALEAWSGGRGEVGTEWRFRVMPPGEVRRPLVPDIAFVAADVLRGVPRDEIQAPSFAPTVAIEILSPDDKRRDLKSKIDVYLRAGSALVVVVSPTTQTIELHDPSGAQTLAGDDTFRHDALPGFAFEIGEFFDSALKLIE